MSARRMSLFAACGLLLALAGAGALAESWVPLTPEEGERFLQEALRYATVEWQAGETVQVGMPYVWGGRTPLDAFVVAVATGEVPAGGGVDASGLVVGAARAIDPNFRFRSQQGGAWVAVADINSSALYRWGVEPVTLEELRPGDLIFFGSNGTVDGVAIYERTVGRSIRFVVASAGQGRVVRTGADLDGEYWKTRFIGAGRLLRREAP